MESQILVKVFFTLLVVVTWGAAGWKVLYY